MSNRRTFIGQCVKGAAGLAVSGLVSSRRVLGANDRVRFGLIGCGSRGKEIFRSAMRCSERRGRRGGRRLYAPARRGEGDRAANQNLQGRPAIARRQERRCCSHRHAATPACPQLRARDPGRQGRVPGEDDGVQPRPRQAHAERARRLGARRPGRHPDDQRARHEDGAGARDAGAHGRHHRHPYASLPQRARTVAGCGRSRRIATRITSIGKRSRAKPRPLHSIPSAT